MKETFICINRSKVKTTRENRNGYYLDLEIIYKIRYQEVWNECAAIPVDG